jgi:hypothetical protein
MSCERTDCPLIIARQAGEQGGADAEAHSLRVACVELMHKLGVLRTRLRSLGVDPDTAYHPSDIQDHA